VSSPFSFLAVPKRSSSGYVITLPKGDPKVPTSNHIPTSTLANRYQMRQRSNPTDKVEAKLIPQIAPKSNKQI
jgi:hypothetical protein